MGGWDQLPEPLLVAIFNQLTAAEALACGQVCSHWLTASRDGPLWKRLLCRDFALKFPSPSLREDAVSWLDEYKRLVDDTPSVLATVLHGHTDEVLHVAFSNGGDQFVTCSKDSRVLFWGILGSKHEVQLKATVDMKKEQNWIHTWGGRFNKTDTLLLVAGVLDQIAGMVSVLDTSNYTILWSVENSPYDVMGAWVPRSPNADQDDETWLSGDMIDFDFEDEDAEEPCAMVQLNMVRGRDVQPVQRNILKIRSDRYDGTNYMRCLLVSEHKSESSQHFNSQNQQDTKETNGLGPIYTLVFLCSQSTSVPHQIGFKKFHSYPGLEAQDGTDPDHRIELDGHVVGVALDRSGRYVFANVRRWPREGRPAGGEPPPIAQEIEMVVIDINTFEVLPQIFCGHKGFTDSTGAFYIYLDTSPLLVSSGSEDHKARIWDRHLGCQVASLQHDECVNCVAFCPTNPGLLVTVSDDKTIKLWMSKSEKRRGATIS